MPYTEATRVLSKAKMGLMMTPNSVFYTTILFSLQYVWDPDRPTASIDGRTMWINPDWFIDLRPKQRIGLLAHEALHVALNHMVRRGDRDPLLFNYAGDYVINGLLIDSDYELPPGAMYDPRYNGMNTEQVYDALPVSDPQYGISDIPGCGTDIIYAPNAKIESVKNDITDIVLRAATQSQACNEDPGSIPGDILLQLERTLNPKLSWQTILHNYMQAFAKDDYSMAKPNRRFMPDYYLPSAYGEAVCNMAIAVDASGSVLPAEFSYFIAEINALQNQLHPEEITLITFDTEIRDIKSVTQNTDVLRDIEFTGGGGTFVEPIMEWARTNRPQVLIVFSDGDFVIPDRPGAVPVVWLINNNPNFSPDYGKVIHYEFK